MRRRQHAVNKENGRPVRSPAGDAFSLLVVRVLRLGGLLTVIGDALARPAGQSSARWQVLAAADHAPSTVAQIARALWLFLALVRLSLVLVHGWPPRLNDSMLSL